MHDGLDAGSVGRWRRELSRPELETIYRRVGGLLERLGYPR
jgi:hypothetical protein